MKPLLRPLQPLVHRLDQLSRRDRIALTLGLVAAALGLELTMLQPMHARRLQIEASVLAADSAQQQAQAQAEADQQRQQAEMQAELARQTEALAALGLQTTSRDTLASFLERGLTGQAVRLTALKDLPVQPLTLPTAPAADPAQPAPATASLYRHRVELQLEGPLPALTQAVDVLERNLLPLRVEQVRLAGRDARGQTLQATVVMTVVNEERTWLTL